VEKRVGGAEKGGLQPLVILEFGTQGVALAGMRRAFGAFSEASVALLATARMSLLRLRGLL